MDKLRNVDVMSILTGVMNTVMSMLTYVYDTLRKATVKDTVRYTQRKWRNLKWAVRNPTKLNWIQASILFSSIALLVLITITQLSSAWEENRPDLLAAMLKFVLYIIFPITISLSVTFGMYLERNFQKFDDLAEFYNGIDHSIRTLLGY